MTAQMAAENAQGAVFAPMRYDTTLSLLSKLYHPLWFRKKSRPRTDFALLLSKQCKQCNGRPTNVFRMISIEQPAGWVAEDWLHEKTFFI